MSPAHAYLGPGNVLTADAARAPAFASVEEFGAFVSSAFNLSEFASTTTLPPPGTPRSPPGSPLRPDPRTSSLPALLRPPQPHTLSPSHDRRLSSYFESDTEADADETDAEIGLSPTTRRRRKRESSTTTGTATTVSSFRSTASRIFRRATSALALRPATPQSESHSSPKSHTGSRARMPSDGQSQSWSTGQGQHTRLRTKPSAPVLMGRGSSGGPGSGQSLPPSPRPARSNT